MDASTSSPSGKQPRQKRVLPSRLRRGGPGVGNCDADMMILDTQRRKPENEPLIPAETPFLLTTNSSLVSTSSSSYQLNVHANERYFERPEVLKAYREQLTIETPEFKSMGDTPSGRLRARSQAGTTEDGPVETSDATYEKRHRKYETFEKRLRLREKEKLKHEQYKLKERIEQLRAMHPAAFLALPDDLFPPPLTHIDIETNDEEENMAQISEGPNYSEGERRRKEMLRIASSIEDRFRVLLPPDRTRKPIGQITMEHSIEPEVHNRTGKDTILATETAPIIETQESERLKIKRQPHQGNKALFSKSTFSTKRTQSAPPLKEPSARKNLAVDQLSAQNASPIVAVEDLPSQTSQAPQEAPLSSPLPPPYHSPPPPPPLHSASVPSTPFSNPEIAVLQPEACSPEADITCNEDEHIYASTRLSSTDPQESVSIAKTVHKRVKLSPALHLLPTREDYREPSVPPIVSLSDIHHRHRSPSHASTVQSSRRYGSYSGATENWGNGLLMTQAIRSSESRTSKGQRHWYAFGGKVQNELFSEEREFEIPHWVMHMDVHQPKDTDQPLVTQPKRSRRRRRITDTDEFPPPLHSSEDED